MLKAVILAAGQGTRMKSKLPKVVHKVLGKCMVEHAIAAAKNAGVEKICVIVGHGADCVKESIKEPVEFVMQSEQLGTGHAVRCAKEFIGTDGETMVLFGDAPLITGDTLKKLVETHRNSGNAITVLSTKVEEPTGYGRIIRNADGSFLKSVEHKDASESERTCNEINSGMYVFNSKELYEALDLLKNDNAQGEYYLPDTLTIIKDKGNKVDAMVTENYTEVEGVNSRVQLAYAEKVMRERINTYWMKEGVTIINPDNTYIGPDATIGQDTVIYPGTVIYGDSVIGEDCILGPSTVIIDEKVEAGSIINWK